MDSEGDLCAEILRYLPYGGIRGGTCSNFYGAQQNDLDCPCQARIPCQSVARTAKRCMKSHKRRSKRPATKLFILF